MYSHIMRTEPRSQSCCWMTLYMDACDGCEGGGCWLVEVMVMSAYTSCEQEGKKEGE